ncbi:MAG: DUF3307 domain-containing protein [Candidatus Omnitrophota bacterium]|jgi:hypothetical protein
MFIFIRLLLGHFVGDFPLQFDRIYRLKHKGITGVIPHALLVSLSFVLLSWPYLNRPGIWIAIVLLGLTHLYQDSFKLGFSRLKYSFYTYLLDQISHVALISVFVFLTGIKNLTPPPENGNLFITLYNSDTFMIYLIAMIFATYNGFFLVRSFKNTFLGGAGKYNIFDKWYGIFERAIIVYIFFLGGFFFFLIPALCCLRPAVFHLFHEKFGLEKDFISIPDMLLNWAIAFITGFALHLIL